MLRIEIADQALQTTTSAIAATSALGSWWLIAGQVVIEIFGVPIQTVIAAITASFAAQTFRPVTGLARTLGSGALWAMVGSFGANAASVAALAWHNITVPGGALAGVAMLIAGSAPFIMPVLIKEGPEIVQRWLQNRAKDK